jgi:hypothetical protein
MTYVNYLGEEIGLIDHGRAPKAKKEEQARHNGWRVQGIPPGTLEDARAEHRKAVLSAQTQSTRMPKEWDEENWLMTAKRKPVRKPFELEQAARECKALAEKYGWLRVEIVELKKEASVKPAQAAF